MNLTIDIGNTRIKLDIFHNDKSVENRVVCGIDSALIEELMLQYPIKRAIVSSVRGRDASLMTLLESKFSCVMELDEKVNLPFRLQYQHSETLGKDRIAALMGAWSIKPSSTLLVIDIGTCITYDVLENGTTFIGGNIAPGWRMRLESMHQLTHKLPEVNAEEVEKLLGNSTIEAMQGGSYWGIVYEIEGLINKLKLKHSDIHIFLTGGDSFHFEKQIKNCIFAIPNLVPIGLNQILKYNESIGKID